jgi:hypothetical protein
MAGWRNLSTRAISAPRDSRLPQNTCTLQELAATVDALLRLVHFKRHEERIPVRHRFTRLEADIATELTVKELDRLSSYFILQAQQRKVMEQGAISKGSVITRVARRDKRVKCGRCGLMCSNKFNAGRHYQFVFTRFFRHPKQIAGFVRIPCPAMMR